MYLDGKRYRVDRHRYDSCHRRLTSLERYRAVRTCEDEGRPDDGRGWLSHFAHV